jgi:hypothetical protein
MMQYPAIYIMHVENSWLGLGRAPGSDKEHIQNKINIRKILIQEMRLLHW